MFDGKVKVLAPQVAEDSMNVPVLVDASALDDVRSLLVFADLNPIPRVLEFRPQRAVPRIGLRIKVQQGTPVRGAALTGDGVWHLGGVWVDAAGGGCTLPSVGSDDGDWMDRLGETSARIWAGTPDGQRLKVRVVHPMDTGLAPGVPVFHIEHIRFGAEGGEELALLRAYEPVAENPVFTLDFPARGAVEVSGRDNNGNGFRALVTP